MLVIQREYALVIPTGEDQLVRCIQALATTIVLHVSALQCMNVYVVHRMLMIKKVHDIVNLNGLA